MTREEFIDLIESRIKSEYKKHGDLDWAGIAARKICGSLEWVLDMGKEREDLVSVTDSLFADFLKYAIDDTMRISGDHDGLAGTTFVGDTYEKIANDYISICNDRYMKNLENKEILSDDILNAISLIVKQKPTAVFGGSIALNAVGLINRPISDIDLFFGMNESLSKNGYLSIETIGEVTSDTVTNTNGVEIQRTGAKIAGVKTCCFKVSDEELQCSKHKFTRNGIEFTIYIQNVNYAIEAKKSYSSRNPKHKKDLETISNVLDGLF